MRMSRWDTIGAAAAVAATVACASGRLRPHPPRPRCPRPATSSAGSSGTTSSRATWRRAGNSTALCSAGSSKRRRATAARMSSPATGMPFVGGLVERSQMNDRPAVWLAYVAVPDLEKALEQVTAAGGKVLLETHGGRCLRPRGRRARSAGRAPRPRQGDGDAGRRARGSADAAVLLDGIPREGRPGGPRVLQGPRRLREHCPRDRARDRVPRAETPALAGRPASAPAPARRRRAELAAVRPGGGPGRPRRKGRARSAVASCWIRGPTSGRARWRSSPTRRAARSPCRSGRYEPNEENDHEPQVRPTTRPFVFPAWSRSGPSPATPASEWGSPPLSTGGGPRAPTGTTSEGST